MHVPRPATQADQGVARARQLDDYAPCLLRDWVATAFTHLTWCDVDVTKKFEHPRNVAMNSAALISCISIDIFCSLQSTTF